MDLIKKLPLDFLHLGHLGIQKKFLNHLWITHPERKINNPGQIKLAKGMKNLRTQIPCEFQTTTKSLDEMSNWKGTEYSFFLNYCGVFVLEGILDEQLLNMYRLFSVSSRILHSDKYCLKYLDQVQNYLERFVFLCGFYYGPETLVYNFHSLLHVTEDLKFFQVSLSRINCFPFESAFAQIKRGICHGNVPLNQYCNRFSELQCIPVNKPTLPPLFEILSINKKIDDNKTYRIK